MSSIDNNQRTPSPTAQLADELREHHTLSPEEKHLHKMLLEDQGMELIALLGLSPKDIKGTLHGTKQANKFTQTGAVNHMPPPAAPRVQVSPRAQAAYESLASDVHHVVGQMQAKMQPLNLTANMKNMDPAKDPQGAADTVVKNAKALIQQVGTMSSEQMMLAFLVLRVHDQSDGMKLQKAMSDLLSKVRERELKNEVERDKEANEKLQKAMEKQAKMGILSKVLGALVMVLTAVLAVCTFGLGLGLALVAAAMVIGFLAGGAAGGKKDGSGFNIEKAFEGASFGGDAAMMACGVGAAIIAINAMVKTMIAEGTKIGTKAAFKKVFLSGTVWKQIGDHTAEVFKKISGAGAMTGKSLKIALMSVTGVEGTSEIAKAGVQYEVSKSNLAAQEMQQLAKICEMLAMIMQQEWQEIQDFMQFIMESHNNAVNQAMSMMQSHHNSQMKAKATLLMG